MGERRLPARLNVYVKRIYKGRLVGERPSSNGCGQKGKFNVYGLRIRT